MIMKNGKQIGFIYKNGEKIDKIIRHGKVYFEQGFTREKTATTLPISFNGIGKDLKDYKIYGSSEQSGTPTPENSIEIISCGDKTYNLYNYKKENLDNTIGNLSLFLDIDNYLVINGTNNSNYRAPIKPLDITDLLEDGQTYTIYQEDITPSTATNYFSKVEIRINCIKSDGSADRARTAGKHTARITINKNKYVKYSIDIVLPPAGDIYNNYRNRFMLLKGSYNDNNVPSNYEHYGYKIPININNIITNIYLEEPLRKISEYSDYIDFKNNKIIRNIKKLVLNGNESWTESSTNNANIKRWRHNGQRSIILHPNGNNENAKLLSESFQIKTAGQTYTRNEGISVDTSGDILIYYPSIVSGPANFKEWLSNNNVLTIFALQTPIEENIELPKILTANENNTLTIETEVTPSQIYIKYKSDK